MLARVPRPLSSLAGRSARLLLVLGFGLALAPAGSARAADAAPAASTDAASLLARARQAPGGEAWGSVKALYTRAAVSTGGLSGSAESWDDVATGRYLDRFALGPYAGTAGFDGARAWSQEGSGRPSYRESAEELQESANESFRRRFAQWFPERHAAAIESGGQRVEGERRFGIVRLLPAGGRPYEMWIDLATGLPDRTIEKAALETRTTFFSDYRPVGRLRLPFAQRVSNGEPKYDQVVAIERYELDPSLAGIEFGLPTAAAADFTFAAGRTATTIPFELWNNHIYLKVRINDRGPFLFLCDTGGANILTTEAAAALGLSAAGAFEGRGVGEKSEDIGVVKVERLDIGDVTLVDQTFMVFPLGPLAAVEGVAGQGIIGFEVFQRFVVHLDHGRRQLTLELPAAFTPPAGATAVPFRFHDRTPQVDGTIDGLPGVFDIDTGSRGSLTLLAPFVAAHDLGARYPGVEAVTGWGVGGAARGRLARGDKLTLGGVAFARPIVELSLQKKGAFTDPHLAGNVGNGLLARFDLIFDYGAQKIYFAPRADSERTDVWDRSGLWLNRSGAELEVIDVVAGSPGAEAGLAVGDRVLEVDGKPVAELTLPALRARFRSDPPGTKVELTVRRGEASRQATLVLRDLV